LTREEKSKQREVGNLQDKTRAIRVFETIDQANTEVDGKIIKEV